MTGKPYQKKRGPFQMEMHLSALPVHIPHYYYYCPLTRLTNKSHFEAQLVIAIVSYNSHSYSAIQAARVKCLAWGYNSRAPSEICTSYHYNTSSRSSTPVLHLLLQRHQSLLRGGRVLVEKARQWLGLAEQVKTGEFKSCGQRSNHITVGYFSRVC